MSLRVHAKAAWRASWPWLVLAVVGGVAMGVVYAVGSVAGGWGLANEGGHPGECWTGDGPGHGYCDARLVAVVAGAGAVAWVAARAAMVVALFALVVVIVWAWVDAWLAEYRRELAALREEER